MKPTDAAATSKDNVGAGSTVSASGRNVYEHKTGFFRRCAQHIEEFFSRLSAKNNFWHRVFSWGFLPLAYRSGIKFKKTSDKEFSVVLPFKRFNRNWYSAMAGAALLANSEVAGGMFVFNKCGGNYTVVCKHLEYKFLRPCVGPAMYKVIPQEKLEDKIKEGGEFNITLDLNVSQVVHSREQKNRKVGKCTATFHVTPKTQARARLRRHLKNKK